MSDSERDSISNDGPEFEDYFEPDEQTDRLYEAFQLGIDNAIKGHVAILEAKIEEMNEKSREATNPDSYAYDTAWKALREVKEEIQSG